MADYVPATFKIPQAPGVPLEIEFRHEAVRMTVVDRDMWPGGLSQGWQCPGVYLLFGPASNDSPGSYSAYVGKAAPGTVFDRVNAHVKNKEGWDRALLVQRTGDAKLNSTDVGWLEGELHGIIDAAPFAEVLNKTTPGDDTLSDWDRESLHRVATLIKSVMKVLGFRTDRPAALTPDDTQVSSETLEVSSFSVAEAHRVISLVKPGEWTTYGDVAAVVGTHPNALGSHIRNCKLIDGTPEWRVLNRRGESSPGFTWTSSDRSDSQIDVLSSEGVEVDSDGTASEACRVTTEELLRRRQTSTGLQVEAP